MLTFLRNQIRNLIRWAVITGPADNDANYPVQQMQFKGKTTDVVQIFPYGMYSNVSSEESLALLFSVEGLEDNRAAISYTPKLRPKDLEQNETAIYHPFTESFIKFRNDGSIEIDTNQKEEADIRIICNNVSVTAEGQATVEAGGNIDITSGNNVNISADTNVVVEGTQINLKGTATQVLTTGSINPLTGTPFPNGNPNITGDA